MVKIVENSCKNTWKISTQIINFEICILRLNYTLIIQICDLHNNTIVSKHHISTADIVVVVVSWPMINTNKQRRNFVLLLTRNDVFTKTGQTTFCCCWYNKGIDIHFLHIL